jgi:hypothetical protein
MQRELLSEQRTDVKFLPQQHQRQSHLFKECYTMLKIVGAKKIKTGNNFFKKNQ